LSWIAAELEERMGPVMNALLEGLLEEMEQQWKAVAVLVVSAGKVMAGVVAFPHPAVTL